jgi:hypothetical protein
MPGVRAEPSLSHVFLVIRQEDLDALQQLCGDCSADVLNRPDSSTGQTALQVGRGFLYVDNDFIRSNNCTE